MSQGLLVTNIQRMCFHDGPGIRTTIFTKGCSLHCPWCSNPENISSNSEVYELEEKKGTYGIRYGAEELVKILLKDKDFWGDLGGVTFSGGEALLQPAVLKEVLLLLKKQNVHTAIETALFVPIEYLYEVLQLIDYFIVDVKILDAKICADVLGGNLDVYKAGVDLLYRTGKLKKLRIPCGYEYTFSESNKKLLLMFLCKYRNVEVEIFGLHRLGSKKYEALGKTMQPFKQVESKDLEAFCTELKNNGVNARVIQI